MKQPRNTFTVTIEGTIWGRIRFFLTGKMSQELPADEFIKYIKSVDTRRIKLAKEAK